jgi:hypothetical protein
MNIVGHQNVGVKADGVAGVADSVRRVPGSEACFDCRENPLSLVTPDSLKAKHPFKFDSRSG